jgi:hypothetical protein
VKWRLGCMFVVRALVVALLHVHVRDQYASFRASSPLSAAYAAFISYARFKLPMSTSLFSQVQPEFSSP